jgi:hypothetical protein
MGTMKDLFIGLDPGKAGGIAVLRPDGTVWGVTKMPDTDAEVFRFLDSIPVKNCVAVLEHVWAMPNRNGVGMGVAGAFNFGVGYGGLRMALVGNRIPFEEVIPQKWQKYMDCRTGGDKNITKDLAQKLFPNLKVTHALADACLIAEYCRRVHTF